jgi:NADH-quinone oxidoreductase subunit H
MADPVNSIAGWLRNLLEGWGLSPALVTVFLVLIGIIVLIVFVMLLDIFLVWVERKVVARFQDRFGPNRLGPFGLIQPFADIIKLLIKENIYPSGADLFLFNLAPIMALATVLLLWAVIPIAPTVIGADVNVAVLYLVGIGAFGTLGIFIAGWASKNKYALLGSLRMVAQMLSYEVPMVLAMLIPVLLARSMGTQAIVNAQYPWYIIVAPIAAIIFLISAIAELGRAPFDLSEGESEIVAGFHIEYTGMKFGLFYAGELLHAVTLSAIFATLFLGGWQGPWVNQVPILGVVYLLIKAFLIYFVIMWVKYSFPRLRVDQMLGFSWKFLTPLALLVLIVTALMSKLLAGVNPWITSVSMLIVNLAIAVITVIILREYARIQRTRFDSSRSMARHPEANLKEVAVQE